MNAKSLQRNKPYIVLQRNPNVKQITHLAIKPYTKRFTAIENKVNELVNAYNVITKPMIKGTRKKK